MSTTVKNAKSVEVKSEVKAAPVKAAAPSPVKFAVPAGWEKANASAITAMNGCKDAVTLAYAQACYSAVELGLAARSNPKVSETFIGTNKGKRLLTHIATVCNAVQPKKEVAKVAGVAPVAGAPAASKK